MKKFLFNEGPVKIEAGDIVSQLCDLEEFHTGDYRWSELRSERPDDALNLIEVARYLIIAAENDDWDGHDEIHGPVFDTVLLYAAMPDWGDEWNEDNNCTALPMCGSHYWLSHREFDDDPREWKKL